MGELKYFKISDVDLKLHGRMDNTLDIVPPFKDPDTGEFYKLIFAVLDSSNTKFIK